MQGDDDRHVRASGGQRGQGARPQAVGVHHVGVAQELPHGGNGPQVAQRLWAVADRQGHVARAGRREAELGLDRVRAGDHDRVALSCKARDEAVDVSADPAGARPEDQQDAHQASLPRRRRPRCRAACMAPRSAANMTAR